MTRIFTAAPMGVESPLGAHPNYKEHDMKNTITLAPCPTCGAMLSPNTLAAMRSPLEPESCPKAATRG